jgi:hypothetical protein
MDPFDETAGVNPYAPPRIQIDLPPTGIPPTVGIDLSSENPFFMIWIKPRATIRGIVDTNPNYLVIPLALANGILGALNNAAQRNAGDRLPDATILGLAFTLGPIGGLIGLYVGAWALGLSCRWLGGRVDSTAVRAAVAWSAVPTLATIPIWILQLAIFRHEMFTTEMPSVDANPSLFALVIATGCIEFVLAIWSFVILLKTVGEVQGFSAWRALGAVLLITLIVLIPIVILVVIAIFLSR